MPVGVGRAIRRLAGIEEALVVYHNGAADRTLTELDDLQREIAQATGLFDLAREWGTTVPARP